MPFYLYLVEKKAVSPNLGIFAGYKIISAWDFKPTTCPKLGISRIIVCSQWASSLVGNIDQQTTK